MMNAQWLFTPKKSWQVEKLKYTFSYFSAFMLKFKYSEKATKFCEIFPLLLTTVHTVKSKGKILQKFLAFSEYMNFKRAFKYDLRAWGFLEPHNP